MGMYGERLGRGVTREAARKYETSVTERARRERWQASGCARVVAKRLRRDFIGCEINHDYAQMAADRIAAATP